MPRDQRRWRFFHDVAETRVNDQHHLGQSYMDPGDGERRVVEDQTAGLPPSVASRIREAWTEAKSKSSPEARVAKDADRLECLIQAREYESRYPAVEEWIRTARAGPHHRISEEDRRGLPLDGPHQLGKKGQFLAAPRITGELPCGLRRRV